MRKEKVTIEEVVENLWNDKIRNVILTIPRQGSKSKSFLTYSFEYLDTMVDYFGFAEVLNIDLKDYPNTIIIRSDEIVDDYFYLCIEEYEKKHGLELTEF